MSAPNHAKALGLANWRDEKGKDMTSQKARKKLPKVKCQGCGWSGGIWELLAVDEEETMWCPLCKTSGWIYD